MSPVLSTELLGKFQEIVYDRSDLHFAPSKRVFFERQLREKLLTDGFADFESYYASLKCDLKRLDMLVQDLTTNQTFFFRNQAQFEALRGKVFPELIESRNREAMRSWSSPTQSQRRTMGLRIWSAGCSTGEEAYSIAFTLLDVLKYPRAWDVRIIGTDIKRSALEVAHAGIYEGPSLKETALHLMEKYMEKVDGGWAVKELPRSLVRFGEANLKGLSSESGPLPHTDGAVGKGYFDVIFCRNVMIYFDRKGQQRLVDNLYERLAPGGYLFTGDSEPLHLFRHSFVKAEGADALYYRKPEQADL
jgi:chemotaxis protein methyltransferase CheR